MWLLWNTKLGLPKQGTGGGTLRDTMPVCVLSEHGGKRTMCAALGQKGVDHDHDTLGPYNTAHIITFLIPHQQGEGLSAAQVCCCLGQC